LQLKKAARAEQAIKEKEHVDIVARAQAAEGGPLDDPAEEKKRLERIQVAADLELMGDTFGLEGEEEAATAVAAAGGDVPSIVASLPITDAGSHDEICSAMLLAAYAGRSRLNGLKFVKAFLHAAKDQLHVDDLADVIAILNTAKNTKLAASKGKKGKKGKSKPRAFARVETDSDLIGEGAAASSGMGNEFDDFM
jgi:hypothetical protein